jgi:hypothetical protein
MQELDPRTRQAWKWYNDSMTVDHLSYSSLSSYKSCPRSYYLSRIKRAEQVPAWYFAVGTAVHKYIECLLKSPAYLGPSAGSIPRSVEDLFYDEVNRLMAIEPDTSLWLHGGPKEEPVIEERALALSIACAEKAEDFLEEVEVWEVEPDITGHLPGCSLPIKAFPDLLGEHKKHGPVIVDWKTGKSKPKDNLQLETYNALLKHSNRRDYSDGQGYVFDGLWVMLNPEAPKARPVQLVKTPEEMGAMYHEVELKIQQGVFPALPQFNCKFCTQLLNCRTMSGATPRTSYYDTPEKDGVIPF